MRKALLIIDVQKSSVKKPEIVKAIEDLQKEYDNVFISRFTNDKSPVLPMLDWTGYEDESLAFVPVDWAVIFDKNVYSSFIPKLKEFNEVHLCGYDTDACIYKTAMDLIENNIRPVVLSLYCDSENDHYHKMGIELIKRNIGIKNII